MIIAQRARTLGFWGNRRFWAIAGLDNRRLDNVQEDVWTN